MNEAELLEMLEVCSKSKDSDTYKGSSVSFLAENTLDYINRLKSEKQLAEIQLKELLSALYQRTEKPFTLERKDIVELAKDYGIKEEELKWMN